MTGVPPRNSIKLASTINVLGAEIRRLRMEVNMTQRTLVAKLQAAGWDLSFDTLCQIEGANRTLTDVEFLLILTVLKKSWSDVTPPKAPFGGRK